MASVELFKTSYSYIDKKSGAEKTGTGFSLKCGDTLIPVQVCFYPNKETGEDKMYGPRKSIMSAFADVLPDKK